MAKMGIQYLDCGTSGGVYGLERGYCLMVGGASGAVSVCAPIFRALAPGITAATRTDPYTRATICRVWMVTLRRTWCRTLCQNGP